MPSMPQVALIVGRAPGVPLPGSPGCAFAALSWLLAFWV